MGLPTAHYRLKTGSSVTAPSTLIPLSAPSLPVGELWKAAREAPNTTSV